MADICENCVKGSKLVGTPKGRMINTTPLQAYFAPASGNHDSPTYTSKALVISPDIFGLGLDNPKILADMFAEKCGIDVWVPDTFKGHPPMKPKDLEPYIPDHAGQKVPFTTKIWGIWALMKAVPGIIPYRHGVSDGWLAEFIANLRKEYGYEEIALNGYCWGGAHVIRLAAKPGVIDLALPVHPSGQYASAMHDVVVPIFYFLAEEDSQWDPKAAAAVQREWEGKADAPKLHVKTYPGTAHGFGCRPNLSIPKVKESWEAYIADLVSTVKENL